MTTQTPPIQTQQSFRPVRIREGSSDPDFPPIRIAVSSPDPPDCIDHHLAVQRQQSSLSDQQCSRPSNKIPEDKQDLRATKGGIQKIKADQQRSQPSNKIPEDKQDLSATKGGIQKIKVRDENPYMYCTDQTIIVRMSRSEVWPSMIRTILQMPR